MNSDPLELTKRLKSEIEMDAKYGRVVNGYGAAERISLLDDIEQAIKDSRKELGDIKERIADMMLANMKERNDEMEKVIAELQKVVGARWVNMSEQTPQR